MINFLSAKYAGSHISVPKGQKEKVLFVESLLWARTVLIAFTENTHVNLTKTLWDRPTDSSAVEAELQRGR